MVTLWIIGGILTPLMSRKHERIIGAKTYTDKLCSSIWSIVGIGAIVTTCLCLGFLIFAGKDIWATEFVFALLVVGIIEMVQGLIIKENSLVFGGCVGMIAGIVTMCCLAADIPLYLIWYMPLFIIAWICMMIIPGHCINAKARKTK